MARRPTPARPLPLLPLLAAGAAAEWTVVDDWNAVPTGDDTTQGSVTACEATCVAPCVQWSWNRKSHHCYTSAAAAFAGVPSDHVTSGCLPLNVTGCGVTPPPPAPPAPTPAPPVTPAPPAPPVPPGGGGPFGSTWFPNRKAAALNATGGVLLWDHISKPDAVVTYLPEPLPLGKDGAKATVKVAWESDGADSCPASDWADHKFCKDDEPCLHTSIHCLAGTGDFRIGILDTAGAGKVSAAGWAETTSYSGVDKALSSKPFSGYLGYSFRIDPHVSTKAEHYVPKESGSTAVPCSFNFNGLKHPGHALSKERLKYNGCFEAPAGKWTELKLQIERVSSSEAKLTMAMGKVSYSYTHKLTSDEKKKFPSQIDTVLIQYPNGRKYSYVKLAPCGPDTYPC